MNYKTDCLTLSRILRVLQSYGFTDLPSDDSSAIFASMMMQDNPDLIDNVMKIADIQLDDKDNPQLLFIAYMQEVANQAQMFHDEINNRKKFATETGVWNDTDKTDEPEEQLYHQDQYMLIYYTLSKESLNPLVLSLYESLMLYENLMVDKMREGCQSMLAMLNDDKYKSFKQNMESFMKYANFSSFMLDIYNEIEKAYEKSLTDK